MTNPCWSLATNFENHKIISVVHKISKMKGKESYSRFETSSSHFTWVYLCIHHSAKLDSKLEMGPIGFSIGHLYKIFPSEEVTFTKVTYTVWKGLVRVTLNSPLLNLNGSFSNTFELLKVSFCVVIHKTN